MLLTSTRPFHLMWPAVVVVVVASSCRTVLPESPGETRAAHTYIPLDPLPVSSRYGDSCPDNAVPDDWIDLPEALPDHAVRMAVGQYDSTGNISFGPATVTQKNKSYEVVLDYISVDAVPHEVWVQRYWRSDADAEGNYVDIFESVYDTVDQPTQYRVLPVESRDRCACEEEEEEGSRSGEVALNGEDAPGDGAADDTGDVPTDVGTDEGRAEQPETTDEGGPATTEERPGEKVIVPVYVGVGLRMTASIKSKRAGVSLSGLTALAAEAEAGNISGSLVVQTLGITGKPVSAALPLPSELNQTTVQNAIMAIGTIKATLDEPDVRLSPRVVGIYNPIGGGQQVVSGIISTLATERIVWNRPCEAGEGESSN